MSGTNSKMALSATVRSKFRSHEEMVLKNQSVNDADRGPSTSSECSNAPQSSYFRVKQEKGRTIVWAYFEKISAAEAACKVCKKIYKISDTTNMIQHFEKGNFVGTCGKRALQTDQICKKRKLENDQRRNTEAPSEQISASQGIERREECFQQISSMKGSEIPDEVMKNILYMMIVDKLPLSFVDGRGFKLFMKRIFPHYNAPTRNKVTSLLEAHYKIMRVSCSNKLKNVDSYSLICDIFTDNATQAYFGVTIHYVSSELKIVNRCLRVFPLDEDRTVDYFHKCLISVFKDFEIDDDKITVIVNRRNMNIKNAVLKLVNPEKRVSCFAHSLALVVPEALQEVPSINEIIDKIRKITDFIRKSTDATKELETMQKENARNKSEILSVIIDSKTTWHSTFHMVERFYDLKLYIDKILGKYLTAPCMISLNEISIIKEVIQCCKPIDDVATKVSGGDYSSTGSMLIPIIQCMQNAIHNIVIKDKLCQKFKDKILRFIKCSFGDYEFHTTLAMSTILDPRFKTRNFKNHKVAIDTIFLIKQLLKGNQSKPFSSENSVSTRYLNLDDWNIGAMELDRFLTKPTLPETSNPLLFWKNNKIKYPKLYKLGMKYCSLIPSSVPSQRLFSIARNINTQNQNNLAPVLLDKLLFLYSISAEEWSLE